MRLFVCTPTHTLQGGVERILESLAKHLPSRGIEVVFGFARGALFHDPSRFRRAFPDMRGVDVDGTSGTAYGRRRALRRAILDVDPDLVLIARMFDAYPVASELKALGHRLRLAVTVQAYESDYFVDLARYAPFVDLVVASGELIAGAVRKFTSASRVVNIPGGVAAARVPRIATSGPLRIGYVGRLEQIQKRVLDLPPLVEELERRGVPFTFDVAGDGSAIGELRTRMPRARFHGWLSSIELYERIYPALDVLLHVAEWEGLTIAPREAMVHGVVPVVSRFAGAEDFHHGANALTFPVGDVQAAADAIQRLARDRGLLERLSVAARASQQGIRTEEGAIDAWAAAFRQAVLQPPRVESALPAVARDSGLLTSLGVPDAVAELVRRVRSRHHGDPGSEWPHWSGLREQELENAIDAYAKAR